MSVTFPFTLLLLDYWPLNRWPGRTWRTLVWEKLPLFALAAIHAVATFLVQQAAGATDYGTRFSLPARTGNALVSYMRYLGKTVWPESLSPFYNHPGYWQAWLVAGAAVMLIGISGIVWWQRRQRPWLMFGWLWFLGTLVPVIGLVQVGAQAMADRYTYVSLFGIFTILAWGGVELASRWPKILPVARTLAFGILIVCLIRTHLQVRAWRNSIDLYEHSIAAGEDNAGLRYLLASALQANGRPDLEVVAQYQKALKLQPDYINALTQLGVRAFNAGQTNEAQRLIAQTVEFEPRNPAARKNLGALFARLGQPEEALAHYQKALAINPDYADAHHEIAWVLLAQKRFAEARNQLELVVRANRWDPDARCELGVVLAQLGELPEARHQLERALWLRPDFPNARENLAAVIRRQSGGI